MGRRHGPALGRDKSYSIRATDQTHIKYFNPQNDLSVWEPSESIGRSEQCARPEPQLVQTNTIQASDCLYHIH